MNHATRCAYTVPRPFRRKLGRCRRKAVPSAAPVGYCAQHICPCGIGPRTHAHNQGDTMSTDALSQKEKEALTAVKDGGDVYDRGIVMTLRALEKRGLVNIVKAVSPPSGEKQQPYFGAIATKSGLAAIRGASR